MANPANGALNRQQQAIANFTSIGKLSDFVRDLGKFDGRPTELISWITDVEGIFDLYEDLPRNSTEYGLLERTVRRKVIGEASDVLNANNISYSRSEIKSTLLLYYRDKRDLKTLDYELTTVSKSTNEGLSAYYSRVNELLASIIVQIQTDPDMVRSASSHIDYFRDKALDSFARGLEKPLNILLKSADVKTLSKAYQFCLDYYNMDARTSPFRNQYSNAPIPKPRELDLRPPKPQTSFTPPVPPRRPIHPVIQATPRIGPPMAQPSYLPQFPPRPFFPRPFLHKPEPMDVDPSIRSRTINYGNRPSFQPTHNFSQKRPHPPGSGLFHAKRQAHPLEQNEYLQTYPEFYPEDYNYTDQNLYSPEQNGYDTYQYYEPQYESHNPIAGQPMQQNAQPPAPNDETLTVPNDELEASNNGQANFLEWRASW